MMRVVPAKPASRCFDPAPVSACQDFLRQAVQEFIGWWVPGSGRGGLSIQTPGGRGGWLGVLAYPAVGVAGVGGSEDVNPGGTGRVGLPTVDWFRRVPGNAAMPMLGVVPAEAAFGRNGRRRCSQTGRRGFARTSGSGTVADDPIVGAGRRPRQGHSARGRALDSSRANARKVVEVPTSSHCAMLSHPQIVADLIDQAAKATS